MNIAKHIGRAGAAFGGRPAVAVGSASVCTYAQLAARVAGLGGGMCGHLGLAPGDRVAIAMKNVPEFIETLYACWHAGLIAVPINAKLHRDEFAYILAHSGARACFSTPDLTPTLTEAMPEGGLRFVEAGSADYCALAQHSPIDMVPRQPDDGAWLFYTSGTTGRPKGALLTHRNLLAMMLGFLADVAPGEPSLAMAHAAPLSHGSGLYALANIAQAGCQVIPESGGFDPAEIFSLINAWPRISFFAAPTMVKRLLDADMDVSTANLDLIIYGGGPMYVADCQAALERFGPKLSQLYGQGESPMTITALGPQVHAERDHPRWLQRLASVGIPQTPVDVRVVDDSLGPLPVGDVGEIVVRGDSVMAGYWRNESASASAIVDGWLRTGDLGSFDADGFLTLKDRSKDMIISGGTNIYPREVEEVLLRHPDVAEVSVIGRTDREWGESVVAYVVARESDDARASGDLRDKLDAFCLDAMARFKRPKDYRFIDALPKNNYGKVLKTVLRDQDAKVAGGE